MLPNVPDGRYQLKITDWSSRFGTNSPHCEGEIVVGPGQRTNVVRLGGGALLGAFPKILKKKKPRGVAMIPMAEHAYDGHFWKCLAQIVSSDRRSLIRSTQPDGKGEFCFTFVHPGKYRLALFDPQRGWSRREDLTLRSGEFDVGELKLPPGTAIDCRLHYEELGEIIDSIVVRDEDGFTFDASDFGQRDPLRKGRRFGNLWPANWTVEIIRDRAVVESKVVRLIEGEDSVIEFLVL